MIIEAVEEEDKSRTLREAGRGGNPQDLRQKYERGPGAPKARAEEKRARRRRKSIGTRNCSESGAEPGKTIHDRGGVSGDIQQQTELAAREMGGCNGRGTCFFEALEKRQAVGCRVEWPPTEKLYRALKLRDGITSVAEWAPRRSRNCSKQIDHGRACRGTARRFRRGQGPEEAKPSSGWRWSRPSRHPATGPSG